MASDVEAAALVAAYQQSPSAPPRPAAYRPPARQPSGPRPPTGPPRMYGGRRVRWVARRPDDTLPPQRPPRRTGPRLIPRYVYLPRWGLVDTPVTEGEPRNSPAHLGMALTGALQIAGAAFVASTCAHLLRYLLLVINRSTTLPGWLIGLSTVLVLSAGLLALAGSVYTIVAFVRWLLAVRTETYRVRGFFDPRPRWQSIPLAAIPLVNVAGAALLLGEPAEMLDDVARSAARIRLRKLWVGWTVVNTIAVLTVITWWVGAASGSIQTSADALFMVALTAAVSAAFAFWAAHRLPAVFSVSSAEPTVPAHRWVVVA
ncbi:DUF4328 domain-containing protein [Gordonia oryzae]|uniref:DUF4328 domain-containing protein n=1 Tax=Gordonia oryzae TaxID=2487349 RepID=UPI001FE95BE7|nr:DUF4328 domain-containing protein [Gordonia oryzae]